MQYNFIIKSLGVIVLMLGICMLIPVFYALIYFTDSLKPFLFSIIITFLLGGIMTGVPKGKKEIGIREGFFIVSFAWVFAAICGGLPYYFSGVTINITDAFFESMSGFTTTGASILINIESLPEPILLWRSMTQWLGGMGIIVLTIAILPYFDLGGMNIFQAEVPGPTAEKLTPRIQDTAKFLWIIYCLFTIILALILRFLDMSWFDAINHSLTTMATGGFSTKNASIATFQSPFIEWTITLFMLLAGINFTLHYRFIFKGFHIQNYFKDSEFKFYQILIFGSVAIICIFLMLKTHLIDNQIIREISFNVVSIISTTGFTTANYELWGALPQFILMFLMLIGGCAGSTSGGIKVVRILLVFKYMYIELLKILHPSLFKSIKINKTSVETQTVAGILGFLFIYITILMSSILLISIVENDMMTIISSVMTCLSNVGPGFSQVGPTDNFAHLNSFTKWVLSLDMLMGRLELLTIIILFLPHTWRK